MCACGKKRQPRQQPTKEAPAVKTGAKAEERRAAAIDRMTNSVRNGKRRKPPPRKP